MLGISIVLLCFMTTTARVSGGLSRSYSNGIEVIRYDNGSLDCDLLKCEANATKCQVKKFQSSIGNPTVVEAVCLDEKGQPLSSSTREVTDDNSSGFIEVDKWGHVKQASPCSHACTHAGGIECDDKLCIIAPNSKEEDSSEGGVEKDVDRPFVLLMADRNGVEGTFLTSLLPLAILFMFLN